MNKLLLIAALWLATTVPVAAASIEGHIIDASTGKGVPDAVITIGSVAVKGDSDGRFQITADVEGGHFTMLARALGYRASTFTSAEVIRSKNSLTLIPFSPHALYLSVYGIASKPIRESAFAIIHKGGANSLVVDVKSDRGLITYPSEILQAQKIGARKLTLVHSLGDVVGNAHQQGIYMIARIVTFKDAVLGTARPDLAVHLANGALFHDREGLTWTDPYQAEVRSYNIAIAVEAAKAGFDEVQFDYVRFPDASVTLKFSGPADESGRVKAINEFLREAHLALAPYNVFDSVDIFGYVGWNRNDTGIGQQLESIVDVVDYVSPMLYPSGFKFGIPGHKNPMATTVDIYSTIHLTLDRCVMRTHANPKKFRPWLQAFRDYAFGRIVFGPNEVSAQTQGADDAGADGWMLWNPHNFYSDAGLTGAFRNKADASMEGAEHAAFAVPGVRGVSNQLNVSYQSGRAAELHVDRSSRVARSNGVAQCLPK